MNRLALALSAAWIVLVVVNSLTLGVSWLVALSAVVTVGALWTVAAVSRASGRQLFVILFALYVGIAVVNIQIESAAFIIAPISETVRATIVGLGTAAVLAGLVTVGMARSRQDRPPRLPAPATQRRVWPRLPAVAFVYLVLYFVAGMMILPYVRDYYESSGILTTPPVGRIALLQLVRGTIYGASLLPLFAVLGGHRLKAGMLAGTALAIFGGVAPLLLPVDDVMPWAIRRVHMVEILWSNFAFGLCASWILTAKREDCLATTALPESAAV